MRTQCSPVGQVDFNAQHAPTEQQAMDAQEVVAGIAFEMCTIDCPNKLLPADRLMCILELPEILSTLGISLPLGKRSP